MGVLFDAQLLKTVMSIFLENSFKVAAHPTQPNMKCQLLLVLSDGRGVFSDGGMVCAFISPCVTDH